MLCATIIGLLLAVVEGWPASLGLPGGLGFGFEVRVRGSGSRFGFEVRVRGSGLVVSQPWPWEPLAQNPGR